MSIIYEALKKVEANKIEPLTFGVKDLEPVAKQSPPQVLKKKIFLLAGAVFLIAVLFLVIPAVINRRPTQQIPAFTITKRGDNPVQIKKSSVVVGPLAKETVSGPEVPGQYILEGIVYDQKAPFAVINGQQVRPSDKIDLFLVESISEDKVKLINTEDETVLELSLNF